MINGLGVLGRERTLAVFADWTDRVKAGEIPPAPPRPQGIERNLVITVWDWADPKTYLHDEVSTDRRNPTINANGLIYGAAELELGLFARPRPRRSRGWAHRSDCARSGDAGHVAEDARGVTVLGRRSDLDEQEQRPQPDVRREGTHLDHLRRATFREPGLLQGGIEPSVGETLSTRAIRAATWRSTTRKAGSSRTSAPVSARTT